MLTEKPKQQRRTIRTGILASISSGQRTSGRPLPERMDLDALLFAGLYLRLINKIKIIMISLNQNIRREKIIPS